MHSVTHITYVHRFWIGFDQFSISLDFIRHCVSLEIRNRPEIRTIWPIRLTIGSILHEKETATHSFWNYMKDIWIPCGFDRRVWTDGRTAWWRTKQPQGITMLNVINQRKCRTQNFVSYSQYIYLLNRKGSFFNHTGTASKSLTQKVFMNGGTADFQLPWV